jgi:hypothetical protein
LYWWGTLTGWVIIALIVINNIFPSDSFSCLPGGLHPNDPPPFTDIYSLLASPCTASGKILPYAIIVLAILIGYLGMKQKIALD